MLKHNRRLITPINPSDDGLYHSANGRVKRVYEQNKLSQLIEIPFWYHAPDGSPRQTVVSTKYETSGQIYIQTKFE